MAHDVFISHSHKDKAIADAVCAMLESNGIRCWIAPRDIEPGVDWPTAISKALAGSRVFVLIFSGNANRSEDVGRELILAANNKLIIVPFKIENVTPEPGKLYYLARTHWLDAMNPPTQEQIENLATAVLAFLPKRRKPRLVLSPKATPWSAALEEAEEKQQPPRIETTVKEPGNVALDEAKPGEQVPGSAAAVSKLEKVEPDKAEEKQRLLPGIKINSKKMWVGWSAIVLIAALVLAAILWFGNKEKPFTTQSDAFELPTTTFTLSPTLKITPSSTPAITASPAPTNTARPTNTPKPLPWESEFAEPILSLIEKHPPNLTDDFSSGQVNYLMVGYPPTPYVGRFVDGQLIMSSTDKVFTSFGYRDFVMQFDWEGVAWRWEIMDGELGLHFHGNYINSQNYTFTPAHPMNHAIIIVSGESVAVYVNDRAICYTDNLSLRTSYIILEPLSTVVFDNFKFWNLNDLRE